MPSCSIYYIPAIPSYAPSLYAFVPFSVRGAYGAEHFQGIGDGEPFGLFAVGSVLECAKVQPAPLSVQRQRTVSLNACPRLIDAGIVGAGVVTVILSFPFDYYEVISKSSVGKYVVRPSSLLRFGKECQCSVPCHQVRLIRIVRREPAASIYGNHLGPFPPHEVLCEFAYASERPRAYVVEVLVHAAVLLDAVYEIGDDRPAA